MKPQAARTGVVVGIALVAALGLVVSYSWTSQGEIEESRYATYGEVIARQRPWLPPTLPRSATEIHESHEVETVACVGSFRFDPSEQASLMSSLRPGVRQRVRIDRDPSFSSPLPRDPDVEQLARAGFELYSDRQFAFAINWTAGMAYFWRSVS